MVTTIFIDFYGTLCHGKFWRDLEPKIFEKVAHFMFESGNELVNQWMVGEYTSEQINQILSEKFNMDSELLWNSFLKGCATMRADQPSLDMLKRLRHKFRIILITDNMDSFDRFVVEQMRLRDYFDEIYNSFTTKLLKSRRDGKAFTDIMKTHKLSADQCVLIDDSPRVNDIFTKLGGSACLVTIEKPLSYWLTQLERP